MSDHSASFGPGSCPSGGTPDGFPSQATAIPSRISAETYCLGLLASEMGEALQVIGNALRFGLRTPEREGDDGRVRLEMELGDVFAAMRFAIAHDVVGYWPVTERANAKEAKLRDPDQRDNLGRRLAPAPPDALAGEAAQAAETEGLGSRASGHEVATPEVNPHQSPSPPEMTADEARALLDGLDPRLSYAYHIRRLQEEAASSSADWDRQARVKFASRIEAALKILSNQDTGEVRT
jgi:hypothetical protein